MSISKQFDSKTNFVRRRLFVVPAVGAIGAAFPRLSFSQAADPAFASIGRVDDMAFDRLHAKQPPNAVGETFKVTADSEITTVSIYPNANGDAVVVIGDAVSLIRKDRPLPMALVGTPSAQALAAGGFWACFAREMIRRIGAAAWNLISGKYRDVWTGTSGVRPWFRRIWRFFKRILQLEYARAALMALRECR